MRYLVLAFDGTWNQPDFDHSDGDQSTNVYKLYQALNPVSKKGEVQLKFYYPGVGTGILDRLRGGLFGKGLSDKIIEGYDCLVRNYRPGDKVVLVGFSRGAYTARSLAGMIERLGLIRDRSVGSSELAYQFYRQGSRDQQKKFKKVYARPIKIEAIAVWDTVGALGVPLNLMSRVNQRYFEFHDTRLGKSVNFAYQALAIDEHRADYRPTLWQGRSGQDTRIKQCWFAGAHSDIGGGYSDARLSDISLGWMIDSLTEVGLDFEQSGSLGSWVSDPVPVDSFSLFLNGIYALTNERFLRPIGFGVESQESIDPTVFDLINRTQYRPMNKLGEQILTEDEMGSRLYELGSLETSSIDTSEI